MRTERQRNSATHTTFTLYPRARASPLHLAMTRHTRLAMLLASAAAAYGAEATRPHAVTKRGAFVSSAVVGGAEICDACVQGFGVVEVYG